MLKSWRHSIFEAFTWGFESVEVVAMLRLVGEKTRQQRQTARRSSKTPIARANEWEAGGQQRQTKRRSQQTSRETRKKEGRNERKKERRTGARAYTYVI